MIVTDFPSARDRLDSQRSANRLFRSVVEIVGLPTTGCWLWSSVSSIARPQYRARLDTRTTHRQYRSFPRGLKTTDYVNSRRVHSTHEFRLAPSRLSASSSDAALPTDDRTMILAWRITVIRSSTGTRLLPIASKCPPIVCDLRPARFPLRAIVPEAIRSSRLARHRYLLDDYTGRDLAPSKSFDSSRCATRGDRVTSWGPTKLNEKISCRRHDSRGRNFTSSMLEDSKSDCVSFFKRVYFGLIRVTRLMQKKVSENVDVVKFRLRVPLLSMREIGHFFSFMADVFIFNGPCRHFSQCYWHHWRSRSFVDSDQVRCQSSCGLADDRGFVH